MWLNINATDENGSNEMFINVNHIIGIVQSKCRTGVRIMFDCDRSCDFDWEDSRKTAIEFFHDLKHAIATGCSWERNKETCYSIKVTKD